MYIILIQSFHYRIFKNNRLRKSMKFYLAFKYHHFKYSKICFILSIFTYYVFTLFRNSSSIHRKTIAPMDARRKLNIRRGSDRGGGDVRSDSKGRYAPVDKRYPDNMSSRSKDITNKNYFFNLFSNLKSTNHRLISRLFFNN